MLRGAFTLCTISGVPVRIHWTFFILLAWVFGVGVIEKNGSVTAGMFYLALILAIFACVVAHEFGHILAARCFGIRTRDVTLLPIGGVASLERMPDKPWQELVVAIAGPLVNVLIALVIFPIVLTRESVEPLHTLADPLSTAGGFLLSVAIINIWLVIFNLIPAFPMDGGRILRSLLAMITDRLAATRIAAKIGQFLAVSMAIIGVIGGLPMLIIMALFVFIGAAAEASGTEAQELLRGLRVSDIMMRSFRILSETDTVQIAVDELMTDAQTDFPVTSDGTPRSPIIGLVTRTDLIRALAEKGPGSPILNAMRPPRASLKPSEEAQDAARVMRSTSCSLIPVTENGELVGLVTLENTAEAVMVRGALTTFKLQSNS